jgi:hypothetical protein
MDIIALPRALKVISYPEGRIRFYDGHFHVSSYDAIRII